eukprot:1337219-Rhodomonas_salina.1
MKKKAGSSEDGRRRAGGWKDEGSEPKRWNTGVSADIVSEVEPVSKARDFSIGHCIAPPWADTLSRRANSSPVQFLRPGIVP